MRFFSFSLRIILLFLFSVKGCQFCLKVVYNVFRSKMGFILTNEDDKYFCCLLENVINEKMQDQNKIEIDLNKNADEEEVSDFQKKEVNEIKEVNETKEKSVDDFRKNEVNEIKELNEEITNKQFLRTGANKKTPRFPVKGLDQMNERFPVKEGTSLKNNCENLETCESALLARLKNDQKSLKLLDLKMNKLRIKTSENEETTKKNFCFREDRPWH